MGCPRCHSSLVRKEWEEPVYPELSPEVPTGDDVPPIAPFRIRLHMRCENCTLSFTVEPPKRWLGAFRQPNGQVVEITENTPVDVLLDVIESLKVFLPYEAWRGSHGARRG